MDTMEGAPALAAGDRPVLGPNDLEELNRFFDGVAKNDIAWSDPQSNGGRPVFTENWLSVPQVVSHNSRYGDLDLGRLGRDLPGGGRNIDAFGFDASLPPSAAHSTLLPQSTFSMAGYYKVPTSASDLDSWWTSPNMLPDVDPLNPFSARPAATPNNVDLTGSLIPDLHWDGVFAQQHQGGGAPPVDQPQFGSDTRFQRDGFLPGLEGVRAAAEAAAQLEQLECLRPNHSSAPTPTVTTPQAQQQPILWGPAPGGSSAGPARKPSAAAGEPLSIVTAPTGGPSAQHYNHNHQQHPLSPVPTPTTTTTTTTTLTSPKRKKPKPIKDTSSADKKAHNATPAAARKRQKLQHPHHNHHDQQHPPLPPTPKQQKHPPHAPAAAQPKPKRRSPETEAERLARLERQRSKHNDSEKHRRGRVDYLFEHLKGLVPATQPPQSRSNSNAGSGGGGGGGGRGASKAVALAHAAAWVEELQRGNGMLEQVLRGVRGGGVTVG